MRGSKLIQGRILQYVTKAYIFLFFSQKKELTQMEECILFTIQQEQHSGRTQGVKGKAQACVCLPPFNLQSIYY